MKAEDPNSNNSDSSNKSSTSKENDIKSRLRKNPNKTKSLYTDEQNPKKDKKNSDSYWRDICREIVDILKKEESSDLFRHPAVNSFSSVKDKEIYKQRIPNPRDLGTITKKLKSDNYSPVEFRKDIGLCWSNAIEFNEVNTEAYQCALVLRKLTNELYKEKGMDDIIAKYNNDKENNKDKDSGEEKDVNTNDNTNNSNNNTNDSNNTNDKLNESIGENNTKEKNSKEDDKDSNMSNKSNKDDDSYNESETKKHKLTGKKRHRHNKHKEDKKEKKHHRDKDKDDEDKKEKKEKDKNNDKKRGRRRKKIDNDNIIKISKRKINFEDLIKKYPINFPVIASPEEIDKMAIKKGKNKIKKMIKLNNSGKNNNHNHDKNHNHDLVQPKPEIHKKRGRPPAVNIVENFDNVENNNKKIKYTFDWEFINNNKFDNSNRKLETQLKEEEEEKYEPERRKIENEQMSNYDTNCNGDNIPVKNNNKNKVIKTKILNENIHGTENIQKKKKNEGNKNKINNNSITFNNNVIKEVHINNNDNNNNININSDKENQQDNNIEINANDITIKEIQLLTNANNAVKIVEKGLDKSLDLRIEIARYFDNLTDSNFIDLLVYIENIRPQSIRILENDTIYIDMEAFNEDTFNKVFSYIKNIV